MRLKIDPEFQGYCRKLTPQEYSLLEESILKEGCRDPIVVWENIILDGHHRHKICQEHGVEFSTVKAEHVKNKTDALMWMWKNQVGKRNIGWFEKAEMGIRVFKPLCKMKPGEHRKDGTKRWNERVAQIIGGHTSTIGKVDQALRELSEEDLIKLRDGRVSRSFMEERLGYKSKTDLVKKRTRYLGFAQLYIQRAKEVEKRIKEEGGQGTKLKNHKWEDLMEEYEIPWENTEHITGRRKRMGVDITEDGMTVVVLPDIHAQVTSKGEGRVSGAAQAALAFLDEFKPDVTIVLGDLLDLSQLSTFSKGKPRQIEGLRLDHDYALGNQILNRIDKATKGEKVFFEGNHENRVERYLDEFPYVGEKLLSVQENLHLEERGWKFLKEGELLKIGHAYFIHGWYTNIYHSRKHVAEMGDNIFYGHTHDVQSFSKPNPDTMPIISQSLGCLCDLNPAWLRNKPSRWVNAFGIFYFSKDGRFTYYVPIIIDGCFWWNGKYYTSEE